MWRLAYPRVTLILFVTYLVPMGMTFFVMAFLVQDQRITTAKGKLLQTVNAHIERVGANVNETSSGVELAGNNSHLRRHLKELQVGANARALAHVKKHMEDSYFTFSRHTQIFRLELIDANGTLLSQYGAPPPNDDEVAAIFPLLQQSAADLAIEALQVLKDDTRLIKARVRIMDGEHVLGSLRLIVNNRTVLAGEIGLGATGQLYTIANSDSDAALQYSATAQTDADKVLVSVSDDGLKDLIAGARAAANGSSTLEYIDTNGTAVLAAARAIPDTPWTVVATQGRDEVLDGFYRRVGLLGLQLVLIGIILSVVTTGMFSRRIGHLANKVDEFLKRNPHFKTAQSGRGSDELSYLSDTTVAMINHIEQSRNRLRLSMQDTSRALSAREKELRSLDEELIHSAKLAAVGEVTSGIAHELNQPLGALRLKLESLRKRAAASNSENAADAIEALEQCLIYVARLTKLTTNLRGVSRASNQTIEHVSLDEVFARAADLFEAQFAEAGVELQLPPASALCTVHGNSEWLEQIIINLLSNARDAIADVPNPRIIIGCDCADDGVTVTVTDNGSGIPADLRSKVFDAFYTSKTWGNGTGLGLAICRRLLARMGGTIELDTSYTQGARMVITMQHAPTSGSK